MIDDVQNIIERIIQGNNWGLYFKANPLENLPSQDGQHIYKVNDVSKEEVSKAVHIAVQEVLGDNIEK
jgi:hypothetical protein